MLVARPLPFLVVLALLLGLAGPGDAALPRRNGAGTKAAATSGRTPDPAPPLSPIDDPAWAAASRADAVASVFETLRVDGEGYSRGAARAITDNTEAWWIRWFLLSEAKRSIDITYFIVERDVFGLSLLGLLAQKARQGVKIRFMIDSRGSKDLGSVMWGRGYLKELSKSRNVDVRVFNPLHRAILRLPKDLRHVMASNHDKLVLVDDEWVLTGGRNIGVEYFADPRDRKDAFRDTDILMRGAAITARARQAFDEEFHLLKNDEVEDQTHRWTPATAKLELARQVMDRYLREGTFWSESAIGEKLRPLARQLHEELSALPRLPGLQGFDAFPVHRDLPVMMLDKHSLARNRRNDITPNLVRLIDAAEHHIVMQNPYIILTRDIGEALKRASARGVAIVIHTNGPASTDNHFTQAFFLRDWRKILRDMPTARVFAMPGPNPVHAKVTLIDDRVSVIGTYNMDPMSQAINSEVVSVIHDRDFTREHRLAIARDLAVSTEYRIRVRPDGSTEVLCGPDEELTGWANFVTRLLGNLGFLKRLV